MYIRGFFLGNRQSVVCYNRCVMTAEEYIEKRKDPRWYGQQDENGVDLSIIRENLKKTPTQRLRDADHATSDLLWIRANVRPVISIRRMRDETGLK